MTTGRQGEQVFTLNGAQEPCRVPIEETDQRAAAIIASSEDAIIGKTLDGIITSWNPSAERIFGYTPEEAIGNSIAMLVPPESVIQNEEVHVRIGRGERVAHFETRRIRKDGQHIDVSITDSPIRDKGGKIIGVSKIARDITERKKAEDALRMANERIRGFVDANIVGVIIAKAAGEVVEANDYYLDLIGVTREQYEQGKVDWQALTPDWLPADSKAMQELRERGTRTPYEKEYVLQDGRRIPVLLADAMLPGPEEAIATFALDLTERKRADQRLRESEEAFRMLAESVPQLIWVRQPGGLNLYFNQRWVDYTGVALEENSGTAWSIPFHPDDRQPALDAWNRAVASGKEYAIECRLRGVDGSYRWFLTRGLPLHDATGHVFKWFGTSTDIENLKRAEEELRALNESLEQRVWERTAQAEAANRMKSEFLANMSHELRTPLNGIIGFTEFLAHGKPGILNPKQKEYLEDILNSGRHLLQLINDILDLAKVEVGKTELHPEAFSISDAIKEACSVVRFMAQKKDLAIETEVDPVVDQVVLDKQKFKQILYNLLSNAVKFTDSGGSISVIAGRQGRNRLQLRVQDNGIGIKAEDFSKLFVEFRQLDSGLARRHQGTGLGLALAKKMAELQGGTIDLESEPGKGSTFTVVLPRVSKSNVA